MQKQEAGLSKGSSRKQRLSEENDCRWEQGNT